jgi:GT2 family glycosyltransferase
MNRISASLVLYNTEKLVVEESINSFLNSSVKGDLWLIDNSDDGKYKYLEVFNPKIKYISTGENLGYGRAHNIALRNFIDLTDYHIVLNPDISFDNDVIEELVVFLDSNDNVGLVAPKAVYPDGAPQSNGRLIPNPIHLILRRFFSISKFNLKRNEDYELKNNSNSNYLTPVVLGSFMMFRNSYLKEIGLFDERFFLYPEDIDISRRMFEKYDNVICVNKQFIHHHIQESYKSFKTLIVHVSEMIKYFNKWGWIFDKKRKRLNQRALHSKITEQ